eukprot:3126901-Prymnesium_polylepis.1
MVTEVGCTSHAVVRPCRDNSATRRLDSCSHGPRRGLHESMRRLCHCAISDDRVCCRDCVSV